MKYVRLKNTKPEIYSIEEFVAEFPYITIYNNSSMPDLYLLEQYNIYPLVTTNPPILEETHVAEEGIPKFQDGEWHQTWYARELSRSEIDELIAVRTPIPADPEMAQQFFASEETVTDRFRLCSNCPSYNLLTICAECRCIMPLKVKIKSAVCPLGKW